MKAKMFPILFAFLVIAVSGQQEQTPVTLKDLNVDFMLRGYFYAGSKIEDKSALGGFGTSDNYSKAVDPDTNFPRNKISLIATPNEETVFYKEFKGMKVLLVNTTPETVGFGASDSRLYIVQEAIDRDGKWKPVEYLPSSWCGNSYHSVFLGPNEYWQFSAPRFHGAFKTKLRFRLQMASDKQKAQYIWSNEFEGSVNDRQFTVEQGHKPTSLMDPYNN